LAGLKSAKAERRCSSGEVVAECIPRITVLGIGNLLLQDEGVGIHLVQRLADKVDLPSVKIIDGGTTPDILSLVDDNIDKLIIVDAAVAGSKPGTIYRFNMEDLDFGSAPHVSLHELGIVDSLKLMSLLGNRPRAVTIFGIEPEVIDFGLELSPKLEAKMPRIMELVLEEIKETNTPMEVDR
jgi:hydrogenase maturation protease